METYNITIFRQSRTLFGLFTIPIVLIGSLLAGVEFKITTIPIVICVLYIYMMYYLVIGHLTIIFDDNELSFTWRKKLFFNYKPINPIRIDDIRVIVLDDGKFLRKIKTSKEIIFINNSKIGSRESNRFIYALRNYIKTRDVEIIDSWDDFERSGYLTIAYRINSLILISTILIVIFFIIIKGFKSGFLLVLLLFIPQMLLYKQQMKSKLKRRK